MINLFKTLFEARERKFQQEKLFRGESVDLVAKITTDGVMDELSDYSISGVYQATGDNPEGKTYTLSAEIKDGAAILHWTNENDFGANSYNVWGLLEKDGRAAYPIAWRLNFASSPSYPLDEIDPLVRTINFDNYELLNAPFLYLSGGTVTGALSVDGSFQSSNFKGDAGVGIMIGYNAKAKAGSIAIGSSSDVTNAHFGGSNVAIGTAAKIGDSSETDCAVAIGNGSRVNGDYGIAIGHSADAVGDNSIAIGSSGSRVQALAPESIQIGGLSNGLWTPNNTPHSLKVFDKMVLSGDNLTLDPERIPYLNDYQTKSDAAEEHTQLSNDLTAWVEEHIPQPTGPLAPLTIKQNGQTLVEYHPDYNTPQEATIVVPTNVSDLEGSEDLVNQDGLSSVLSDYATNSYVNSSFNNARSYTDEQIDQLSDVYVKKDNIDFLSTDYAGLPDLNNISLFDISHKLNFCIQAISGKKIPHGNLPPDAEYTYVVMADGTQLLDDGTELSDIQEGTLDAFARHNGYSGANDIRAVVLGSGVEALGHHAFAGFENLEMVDISRAQITVVEDRTFQYSPMLRYVDLGTSISAIGSTVFQHSYNLTELTLPESLVSAGIWSFNNGGIEKLIFTGRTKAQVQAMANYPWQMGGCTMVATDETWIA